MVARMGRRHTSLVAAVLAVFVASGTVLAAPGPVIPLDGGNPPPPAYDPTEPYQDERGGRCPAGSRRIGPDGVLDLTLPMDATAMPGPVIPVGPVTSPAAEPCLSDLRLDLIVEAPGEKKPDGANGNLDGIAVPRSSLESGFEVTLPAADRVITLEPPGENWELKSTSCSCSGWTTLTGSAGGSIVSASRDGLSYPQPVIPVPPAPLGGPGGCSGAAPIGFASPPAVLGVSTRPGSTELASYPAPVLPVDALPRLEAPSVEWDSAGTVTITDPDAVGGTFTCVWTVELIYGQLDIETITTPSGEENRFRYDVVPTGGQPDASPLTVRGSASERLRWGPWSAELAELPEGWKVKRSSCSEADSSLVSLASGQTAQVGLDPDDAVKCRFELELLAPKPGRWKANNKSGKVVCSQGGFSIPFDLSRAVDFGRLRVRDDGDTLVATGGGNSFTFRRDRDDPLRYRGTKRFRQAGFTLDFDIRLNLESETRMTGTLRAKGKGRGATCTIRRPITLTHASAN